MRRISVVLGLAALATALGAFLALTPRTRATAADAPTAPKASMATPEYDAQGRLLCPQGYERWTLVGTSQGLDYSPGEGQRPPEAGVFHNVYLQPEAFDHYVDTGQFPEQSIFVVTNCPPRQLDDDNAVGRHGRFAGETRGLEVSVFDSRRFDDGWGFFLFHETEGPRAVSAAFPTSACMDCHAAHGEDNGVFVQFYSVLKKARAARLAETPGRFDESQ